MAGTTFTIKTKEVLSQDYANALLRTLSETLVNDMNNNTSFTAHLEPECSVIITPPKETVKIFQDNGGWYDPLDCDEPFIMYCNHKGYRLGHKGAQNPFEQGEDGVWHRRPEVLGLLPLYLYDHSGITMSTGAFSCNWDSGQVGWIYYTQATLDVCGCKAEDMREIMTSFVKNTYAPYLEGQVFSYSVINEEGEVTDSCSGFIGHDLEATGILDNLPAELHDSAKAAWEKRF